MSASMIKPSTGSFFKKPRIFAKRSPTGFPIGPRAQRRLKENANLRKLNIRYCEIRISPNCAVDRMLTWAHSQKSRYLVTSKDWQEAARCCLPCHDVIEAKPHSEMKRTVLEAINKRSAMTHKKCCSSGVTSAGGN